MSEETVIDKTKSKEAVIEEPAPEEAKKEEGDATTEGAPEPGGSQEGGEAFPPPDFSSFVFSISTTVLMDLGEIEHPVDKDKKVNLKMAKHSIDVLDMLKTKTEGNLTDQESALVKNILSDLKLRYCKKTS